MMNSRLPMLLWAEWRQRRTPFFVCLLWMVCGTAYCVAYEWSSGFRAPVASFYSTASLYGLFVPIFLAMRTSLGETTDRTRSFSDGLPISERRRGWIRLAGGAGVLVTPIVAGALLLSVCLASGWLEQAPTRPPQDAHYVGLLNRPSLSALSAVGLVWQVTALVAWSATGLYLVLSLLGTTLRSESHLGYCGAAVAMLWFLGDSLGEIFVSQELPGIAAWIGAIAPQAMIINYGYGHERGGFGDLAISSAVLGPLLVNAVIQFGLAAMFVRRYSRTLSGRAAARAEKTAPGVWRPWTPRLPTRGSALAWLALRQSVPMCLPGLVIACVMTPFQIGSNPQGPVLQRYIDSLSSSMWIIGMLWSVVVGAGIFSAEIDWRIGEFWRTRPIPAWRLFGVKFVVGLLAVLLVLDGTVIAATWNSPNWGDYHSMNGSYIACFLPLHATMFAIAVAWTCVLRRAVMGGMAAIATFALTNIALEWSAATRDFDPIQVYNHLGLASRTPGSPVDFTAHGYPLVAATMGSIVLISILIGWLALRRYDPRRQSG
jgi:ABC-type transport system involved in multi-copper enzyme maturation permease subunit